MLESKEFGKRHLFALIQLRGTVGCKRVGHKSNVISNNGLKDIKLYLLPHSQRGYRM